MATSPQDIIDAIDAAILAMAAGGGAQRIRFADGKEIEYKTIPDLLAARSRYQQLADTTGQNTLRISPLVYGDTM